MANVSMVDVLFALPILVPSLGALLVLLLDVFLEENWPRGIFTGVVLVGTLGAIKYVSDASGVETTLFSGVLYHDPFSVYFFLIITVTAALTLLMSEGRLRQEGIENPGEFYALYLMATAGAMIFVAAAELITLFLGLEIMSMALYCLCGSAVRLSRSSESALKYFFLGSFSSAFLLFGIALLYGLTGSTQLEVISENLVGSNSFVVAIAMGFLLFGFIFKIGAVPFHFWAPDVYQGAPTPVTAFMACTIKASALGAALRVLWMLFVENYEYYQIWSDAVWMIAILTMIIGNVVALRQRSLKRMLAYSSVGHAGYMLVAFLAPMEWGGGAALLYYIAGYGVMTIGAFGVVLAVTAAGAQERDGDDITTFNGLGNSSPVLAALMTLFLLSLAGLPPGMAGFVGKFYVFSAAVSGGYTGLVIVGVLCSAVSCYYYLRVVVAMYFIPAEAGAGDASVAPTVGLSMGSALGLCAGAVLLLGLFPSFVYDSAKLIVSGLY